MSEQEQKCKRWTTRTHGLLLTLMAGSVLTVGIVYLGPEPQSRLYPAYLALGVLWTIWIALQFSNYRLVSCGPQDIRFKHAPGLINRPDLIVRVCNHLLVNWTVIVVTILIAWKIGEEFPALIMLCVSIAATLFVWIEFNLLHKQFNRFRNLFLSSTIAAVMIAASLWLLRAISSH